jgi:hypothetical protein
MSFPQTTPRHIVEQIESAPWKELELLEYAGHLLFPAVVQRKKPNGEFESDAVMLRAPRPNEVRKARVTARAMALSDGLDVDRDKDLIDDLEDICLLSQCVRNSTPPHEPWVPDPREFESRYDLGTLEHLYSQLHEVIAAVDPKPSTLDHAETLAVVAAIAERRDIHPLRVLGPAAQSSCIIFMADQCVSCWNQKSSRELSEHSTQGS